MTCEQVKNEKAKTKGFGFSFLDTAVSVQALGLCFGTALTVSTQALGLFLIFTLPQALGLIQLCRHNIGCVGTGSVQGTTGSCDRHRFLCRHSRLCLVRGGCFDASPAPLWGGGRKAKILNFGFLGFSF